MSIYRCHVRDIIWKFAKFLSVRNKACDKRFPYIAASLFPSSPTGVRLCAGRVDSAWASAAIRLRGLGRRVCRSQGAMAAWQAVCKYRSFC